MYKCIVRAMVIIAACVPLLCNAAEVTGSPPPKNSSSVRIHGDGTTQTSKAALIDLLKKQKLTNYPSMTIGEAFDKYRYLKRKEWKETPSKGKTYIDFSGWFSSPLFDTKAVKEGIVSEGLEVKFVISPDGTYGVVMISRMVLKADGRLDSYPLTDISGILNSIYGNREIR